MATITIAQVAGKKTRNSISTNRPLFKPEKKTAFSKGGFLFWSHPCRAMCLIAVPCNTNGQPQATIYGARLKVKKWQKDKKTTKICLGRLGAFRQLRTEGRYSVQAGRKYDVRIDVTRQFNVVQTWPIILVPNTNLSRARTANSLRLCL
jgi:hypothetical protein